MKLNKKKEESLKDFCLRWAEEKKFDKTITWQDIADAVFESYGEFKTASGVKSLVRRNKRDIPETELEKESMPYPNPLEDKLLELKKERVKLQDERTQNNAYIRRLAREDTIKEIALAYAEKMTSKKF